MPAASHRFTTAEVMAVVVAHEIRDGEVAFIGIGSGRAGFALATGIPLAACELARRSHAPNLTVMLGPLVNPDISALPPDFGDYSLATWPAEAMIAGYDALDVFKRGRMSFSFLSASQIDRRGNLNIVTIGDHARPRVRLVGCLAQPDHAAHAGRTYVFARHDPRAFVERVDFVSAPGFLDGPGGRERAGLRGGGPALVVTDRAVLGFDPAAKTLEVRSWHPGFDLEAVRRGLGIALPAAAGARETASPTAEELRLLREAIDPGRRLLDLPEGGR